MTNTITKVISFISAIVIATSCTFVSQTFGETASASKPIGYTYTESSFTSNELKCIDVIYNALLNREDSVDIYSYGIYKPNEGEISTLSKMIAYISNNHPEIFWRIMNGELGPQSGYYYDYTYDKGRITNIYFDYWFTESELATAKAKVNKATDKLLDSINDDWSDVEKAMYVHDYIISTCSYNDNNDDNIRTIYSVLVNHEANCVGYTDTYKYIMSLLDIECTDAYSYDAINDKSDHTWNKIKIDGEWYNVDVCQDDLAERTNYVTDPSTFAQNSALYTYFMVSDDVMEKEHGKVYSLYSADDTSYDNAFWRSSRTQFVYHDATDTWYGCTDDGIVSYCFATNKLKRIYSFKENWKANSGKAHYAVNLSNVVMDGNMIYFNTNKAVLSYNISTKTLRTVITSSGCQSGVKQIYYLYASNNTLKYAVGTDMYTITNIYKAKDL